MVYTITTPAHANYTNNSPVSQAPVCLSVTTNTVLLRVHKQSYVEHKVYWCYSLSVPRSHVGMQSKRITVNVALLNSSIMLIY